MEDVGDEAVEWGVLPHPPQAGPDSVVNFDLTRGESDTEGVRTVPAGGYSSDDEEEELPPHMLGAATRRAAFTAGPLQDRFACRIGRDQYRGSAPSGERVEALHASAKDVAALVPKRESC